MRSHLFSFLGGVGFATGAFLLAGMQSGGPGTAISGDVREFLSAIQMVDLPDGYGGTVRTIRITGNVQIVNGTGSTHMFNGSGNLTIGYNEDPSFWSARRGGSHNLVLGRGSNHLSGVWGGIVAGNDNVLVAPQTVVLSGTENEAYGPMSVIITGTRNRTNTSGPSSAILGGHDNRTDNYFTTVSGGRQCRAAGMYASAGGGWLHTALGDYDWTAGSLYEDQ